MLMGQTPPEVDFCGAITKPPLPNGQTAQYYDRFGNAYTDADFPYPGGSSGAYRGSCNSGYFDLVFVGDWSAPEEATICKVFNDLSDMIANQAMIFPIRILVEKYTFDGGVLGTGSPLWKIDCGMVNSRILERLYNDKYPHGVSEYLGFMKIHDASIWHTIADDISGVPNLGILPDKFDLYSVALHEALHILGIASRISLTGSPLDGFYSRWDRFIYSLSGGYLLSPNSDDECCSAHTFNTAVFTNMPNDFAYGCPLQLAFKNDAGTVLAPVNVASAVDFSGASGDGLSIFLNKLSHLDNACAASAGISGTTNYIMHPGISAGSIKRTTTDAEKQILCALGYHIIDPPVGESCEQPCEVFLKPDIYHIFLEESNTIDIPISGTTNSIFFNDLIPVNATINFDFNCSYMGDLSVDISNSPNYLSVLATSAGIFKFCYTVETDCPGICQSEVITILVKDLPVDTQCDNSDCNIICFGDFESFMPMTFDPPNLIPDDNYFNQFNQADNVLPYRFDERLNTPDVQQFNDNNVLHLFRCAGSCHWETVSLPLSHPIPPDCTVHIEFQAFAIEQFPTDINPSAVTPTLLFTALSDYPCASFPFFNCQSSLFSICSDITAANMTTDDCGLNLGTPLATNSNPTTIMSGIDFTTVPTYAFSWTNNTAQNITTLLMSVNNSAGNINQTNGYYDIYIDNLVAVLECEKKVNLHASDQEVCRGDTITIPYTLCFENAQDGDIINSVIHTNVADIPGLTVISGGDFNATGTSLPILLSDNPNCQTVELVLHIGNAFTNEQEIIILAELTNVDATTNQNYCTDYLSEGISITLTILDCGTPIDPPFDCLDLTNFYIVNAATPTVYELDEFGLARLSYSPPASQTWQPGSHPFAAITGNSPNLYFNVDLVVPQNTQLNINNMNLFFAPDKRILVQPGATLALLNTVLDGVCEIMWTGIQVQGPGIDTAPSATNAGTLNMYQSEVRNAVIGIANMNLAPLNNAEIALTAPPDNPYINVSSLALPVLFSASPAKATSGGLLNIHHAIFTDCFQDINISWAPLGSYYFANNKFHTEGAALWAPFTTIAPQPEAGIHATWCNRVTAVSCQFNNHKYGIRANNVVRLFAQDNLFEADQVGISTRNFKNAITQYSIILNNAFNNCRLALQADGNDLCKLIENKVNDTGNSAAFYYPQLTAAFYLRGSNIEATNNFLHRTDFGFIVNQSDIDGSRIAGNLINNTQQAIVVEGDNSATQFWCNHLLDYTLCGLDLRAFALTNGILPQQGDCFLNAPAANSFIPAATGLVVPDLRLGPAVSGFEVQNLLYHDVGASSLNVEDLSLIGNYISEDCSGFNQEDLYNYCSVQGYTPLSDVTDYIGLEAITDRDLAQQILRLLADSLYTDALSLLQQYHNRLLAQRRLVPHYIATDSIAIAQNLLNQITATTQEAQRFKEFHQLLIDLRNDNRTIFDINTTEEQQLYDIASSGTKTSYKAQAFLYLARGIDFPVVLPALASGGGNWYSSFKHNQAKMGVLYPNPAQNKLYFAHQLSNRETGSVQLFNLTGIPVGKFDFDGQHIHEMDISGLLTGLYLYTISINGQVVKHGKLTIIR